METIQFVRNHNDLSTERGHQFEFFCDRCGSGHRTEFQGSAASTVTDLLDTAGSLLGGIFNTAADLGQRARSAAWERGHDAAFRAAVEQIKPRFKKCSRCSNWVDEPCWNPERGLCKDCTPDLETEYSVAQTQAAIEQAREKAREATYVTADKFNQTVVATCSQCGADVKGAKFCPECGAPVKRAQFCKECGADAKGAKFCPECGTKQ